MNSFMRILNHTWDFYTSKLVLILIFSVPFIIAALIPALVPAPTYLSMGGFYLRTGSIPELGIADIVGTIIAYAVAGFIISDAIANINVIIKAKRTQTKIKKEILDAVALYGVKIFFIYIILTLLIYIAQLITFGNEYQGIIFPIISFLISLPIVFAAPAIVIDGNDTVHAVLTAIKLIKNKFLLVLGWAVLGLILLTIAGIIVYAIVPDLAGYAMMFLNGLFILPFLIVLASHIYMERYPLAK